MKKFTFVIAAAVLSAFMYFGSVSQPAAASSNDGVLTDTTKKEKKPVKTESKPAGKAADSTKSAK